MPQRSYGYASGSVRVLEGRLLSQDRVERMLQATSAMDALKALQEAGYGRGDELSGEQKYEDWLTARGSEMYAFVRGVSPETAATDAFLIRHDYINAQALYKARCLSKDASGIMSAGGTIPLDVLTLAIRDQSYRALPPEMGAAIAALDQLTDENLTPQAIDAALDRALFEHIARLRVSIKSPLIQRYLTDLADLTNFKSALRARAIKLPRDRVKAQMVAGGSVPIGSALTAVDEPERALNAFSKSGLKPLLADALAAYQSGAGLAKLERDVDTHLLRLIKKGKWHGASVEPLIGYMLGVEREIACIRLIMVGHINGFAAETVRERLGELYV